MKQRQLAAGLPFVSQIRRLTLAGSILSTRNSILSAFLFYARFWTAIAPATIYALIIHNGVQSEAGRLQNENQNKYAAAQWVGGSGGDFPSFLKICKAARVESGLSSHGTT